MPRYFFHIRDGKALAKDPEGAEYDSLELAREEAVKSARELLSRRVLYGEEVNGQTFELTDELGNIAGVVRFRDVLRLRKI